MNSLRQLAKQLNISHATVSAALRGLPGVKSATRQRILSHAERVGYRANPLASAVMGAMRRARTGVFRGVIAILRTQAAGARGPAAERHATILAAARRRAAELGFGVDELPPRVDETDLERLPQILDARGAAALLVMPLADTALLHRLPPLPLPVLYADTPDDELRIDAVCPDYHQGVGLALAKLRALGRVNPGLVLDPDLSPATRARCLAAFRLLGLGDAGQTHPAPEPLVLDPARPRAATEWMRHGGCDALLGTDRRRVRALFPEMAEDFFEIGCEAPGEARPAGLVLPLAELGRCAVETLCRRAVTPGGQPEAIRSRVMLPMSWTPRRLAAPVAETVPRHRKLGDTESPAREPSEETETRQAGAAGGV